MVFLSKKQNLRTLARMFYDLGLNPRTNSQESVENVLKILDNYNQSKYIITNPSVFENSILFRRSIIYLQPFQEFKITFLYFLDREFIHYLAWANEKYYKYLDVIDFYHKNLKKFDRETSGKRLKTNRQISLARVPEEQPNERSCSFAKEKAKGD